MHLQRVGVYGEDRQTGDDKDLGLMDERETGRDVQRDTPFARTLTHTAIQPFTPPCSPPSEV